MAIAGKVAITLSTENGGAWSADVTYDRLVAVKHNNNLYISRKTVANVEPPNDEFWFLALEGFGGDDVQALIDQINALSELIQEIIDGTQQVGNAKTLDGHKADFFVAKTGQNVVQNAGTTPLGVKNTSSNLIFIPFYGSSGLMGYIGFEGADALTFLPKDGSAMRKILHSGNKPTGTYTGNGDATARTIATGGIGNVCVVYSGGYMAIVSEGAIISDGSTVTALPITQCSFFNGNLVLATTSPALNPSSGVRGYIVL